MFRFKRTEIVYVLILIWYGFLNMQIVSAQDQPAVFMEDKVQVADVELNLKDTRTKLEEIQGIISAIPDNDTGDRIETLRKKNSLLNELKTLYERQLSSLQRIQTLKTSITETDKEIDLFQSSGLPEKPPYTVVQYDSMTDQIESEQQKNATLQLTKDSLQKEITVAQGALEKAEKKIRDTDELRKNADASKQAQLENELKVARLEQSIARSTITFKRLQLRANELDLALSQKQLELYKQKMHILAKQVRFDKKDFSQKLLELDKKQDECYITLEKAKITVSTNEVRLTDAREQLEAARGEQAIQRQRDLVNNFDAWLITSQYRVENLEERLQLYSIEKDLWQIRYNLFNEEKMELLPQWREQVALTIEKLERNLAIVQARLLNIRSSISDLQKRLSDEAATIDKNVVESNIRALRNREELINERLTDLNTLFKMTKSVQAQLDKEASQFKFRDVLTYIKNIFAGIWRQELLVLEDNAITVRKVVVSLFVFFLGLMLAKRATYSIRQRAIKMFRIEESAAVAVSKISYYFLVIVLLLLALHMVNIPLTLFTFMGGALAIAVGFGAQNLLNNFLSGLIILMERPIKLNDVIEVDGQSGRVRDIGARYTLIRLFSGIDLLMPNSTILERNVINWTHSDMNVRFSVKIGVAYGSDTRKVDQLLMRAAKEEPRILKAPEPVVIFTDFGDNSLVFEVFFWLQIDHMMSARVVASDLRHRIAALMKEAKITIAFPQRDIHLDTQKPVQITLVPQQQSDT
ncbi:MAG: mechanosensitive ion channel [Candidatus Auribacterota bacterium]|nr:mechanosensitive ion channel [Candidatus Auribacterota bacterium]